MEQQDGPLLQAAAALAKARDRHAQAHATVQDDERDSLLVTTAHDVLRARAGFYRLLQDSGWQPPASVERDLALDELLLEQGDDRAATTS